VIGRAVTCEECGAIRGEGNHWFELRRTLSGAPYFSEWTPDAEQPGTEHICGEACAHTVLSKHLTALREVAKEMVTT
jgi:hypothetical protein